jgi:mono/diheme cytochrome c family protein
MRRLALILAALVLAFPVAGCGGGDSEDTAPETVENGGADTATEADTVTEAEETVTEAEETVTTAGEEEAGEGDPAKGKTIFAAQGCGSCHTLADAGSSGNVGPNLDDAKPDFDTVVDKVTNGAGVMPSFSDQLSEQEIKDVAAYVSTSAGS